MMTTYEIPVLFASLLTISNAFNPLFKVLFIFPSRYLFAIGLSSVFSFRSDLPPRNIKFRAAIPNNSTRKGHRRLAPQQRTKWINKRGSHPLWRPIPGNLHLDGRPRLYTWRLQFEIGYTPLDFKSELIPLRSPLLRKSLLLSFPPLIDMLKFSG